MFKPLVLALTTLFAACTAAKAVDLESFFFNDSNGTQLTAAANTANPTNFWTYADEATIPGDETTGDISDVQSGNYRLITDGNINGASQESRFLDIADVTTGKIFLTTVLSDWNFGTFDNIGQTTEQLRFGFLRDDTGSAVTAQMLLIRDVNTGMMTLAGDATGTSGSFDISNTVDLPDNQTAPFTMVLAVDLDSDSYEVFYKDGTNATQVLGLGGISQVRNAQAVRMVTDDFGLENALPFVITEQVNIDSIVVSTTNPLTDLVTLEVDRETGAMSLVNNSGADVTGVTGVTLVSDTGSVDLSDFVDFSGTLSNGQTVALDSAPGSSPGLWIQSPVEDIRAELSLSGGGVRTLDVDFVGNGGLKWLVGDLDFDGTIDADDYAILTANAESTLTGSAVENYQAGDLNGDGFNDVLDFAIFKDDFISANSAQAFANLVAAVAVPEPSSAALAFAGLAVLVGRRRRNNSVDKTTPEIKKHKMNSRHLLTIALVPVFALLFSNREANAIILHDFGFGETAGTAIEAAANSVTPAVQFDSDGDSVGVVTNGLGQLDLSGKDNNAFGSHYIDIAGITTGKVFGVMETTWDFQSTLDTSENEELRISLVTNDPRSTFITAQVEIERNDSNELEIFGEAFGSGTDIPAVTLNNGSLTQTDTFITVIEADLSLDTYEIYYSANDGLSFQSIGSGAIDPARGVESVRVVFNNDFVNDNVLVDRFFFSQDDLPFELNPADPDRLALYVHPISGHVGIVDDTSSSFDIDYYRILSGDDSLLEGNWNSLEDQALDAVDGPDGGSTAGDGIGETWTEAGGSDAGVLSESFLLSSSVFDPSEVSPLGRIFDLSGDSQQLTFEYRDATTGDILVESVQLAELMPGDFNVDGKVDAADYTVFRDNASGLFTASDYTDWVNNFGAVYSQGASLSSATAVPEPSSIGLILVALGGTICLGRNKKDH